MTSADLFAVGLMGLLGGAHCAGMCAPFALAVSAGARGNRPLLLARHAAYHAGKSTAYVLIGVVLHLAAGWVDIETPVGRAQNLLAWIAGGTMMLIGIGYALGTGTRGRWWRKLAESRPATGACGALRALWTAPTLWSAVLTGWINGFLPCGLSFAALFYLASRDSIEGLVIGCYVFGFGTLPSLLAVGWLGSMLSARLRGAGVRIAGIFVALLGLLTVFRGSEALHHAFH